MSIPPDEIRRNILDMLEAQGGDSPPRLDQIAAPLPPPRYHLDVIGTAGGKATTETKR